MGQDRNRDCEEKCTSCLQKYLSHLNLTFSPKIRHVTFIHHSNAVYMQEAATVLPTKLQLQSAKKEQNNR
jgi:hypothetical protein